MLYEVVCTKCEETRFVRRKQFWHVRNVSALCVKCSRYRGKGEDSATFKGKEASYHAKHIWMSNNYGHPKKCEHCEEKGVKQNGRWNIQWANISGKFLREDRKDWKTLCGSCHRKYDLANGLRPSYMKLYKKDLLKIQNSVIPTTEIAKKYNISTRYVHQIKSKQT